MFDRYLPLMKALNVDWFTRSHQFSPIPASAASARMVSPTRIILALSLLSKNTSRNLSVMGSIWKAFCDEVWKNMSPGYVRSSYSSVGIPIMRLYDSSSTFTNVFVILLHQGSCSHISLINLNECFWILYDIFLWREFNVYLIVIFSPQSLQAVRSRFLRGFCLLYFVSPS